MKIGELARRAGVTTSKVRFYEGRGLMLETTRTQNGYRSYGAPDLERLIRVIRAQALGFSLDQIAGFMNLPEGERRAKTGVIEAAEAKLAELDLHLAEVKERRRQLTAFLAEIRAEMAGRLEAAAA